MKQVQLQCFASFLRTLFRQNWVVFAKPAFGGPEQVIRYLGRYTHRVAISNHRLPSYLVIENPRQPALLFDSTCLAADFR